jgi:hypothetical protein
MLFHEPEVFGCIAVSGWQFRQRPANWLAVWVTRVGSLQFQVVLKVFWSI